jgi:NhaP-type Na+/H+ and K+/H+ antiporter|tara:strand:- start:186 stop:629 length:444 start_codon:yes stop_codon:yes gene_type:complete
MDPLTIATAAFGAIKQGVSVGKELHSLSGQIIKFVKQMNVVEEEHKKEKSKWFTSSNEEALDTYFKLKQVHDMENQLREMFMLYGAPNAWSEFIAIRTDIKKKRQAAIAKKKKEREDFIMICAYGALVIALIGLASLLLLNSNLFKN